MMRPPARPRAVLAAAAALSAALGAGACGIKGPPHPPAPRGPAPAAGVVLRQEGSAFVVDFHVPDREADGRPVAGPVHWDVRASAGPRTGAVLTAGSRVEAEFAKTGRVVASGTVDPSSEGGRVEARFGRDALPGVRYESSRIQAGVVLTDARGRRTNPAKLGALEPVSALDPPGGLTARLEEKGVALEWTLPPSSPMGNAGAVLVERRTGEERWPDQPLQRLPGGTTAWLDDTAAPGSALEYRVRVALPPASPGASGPRLESASTEPVTVQVVDRFAPSPPAGLVLVADAGMVRLFWDPGAETDLAGWIIERAEGQEPAGGSWKEIARQAAAATAYEDAAVTAGTVYFYRVRAFDHGEPPNVSEAATAGPAEALAAETPQEDTEP